MVTIPAGLSLYPHQEQAADFLAARKRAGLFDEQGLGKTISSIVAAERVQAETILVLAPVAVAHNWAAEFRKWAPHRVVQVVTSGRSKLRPDASVVITTHALLLSQPLREQLFARRWSVAILDEAHMFKNPRAKRTKQFYNLSAQKNRATVVTRSDRVWVMTGTPMPNNASELWTMLYGLDPRRLLSEGTRRPFSFFQFREKFCVVEPTAFGDRIIGNRDVPELRERMRGFALRRRLTDHIDLPPIVWGSSVVAAPKSSELRDLEADLGITKDMAPETLMATLRDNVEFSTWRRLCGEVKAPAAAELLAEELAESKHKLVVFAHHTSVVDTLLARLAEFNPVEITGRVDAADRQQAVQRFQDEPGTRVAVCQIVAGGVGITLTAAHHVVFVERSFVPGENAQAASRCHRIGQTQRVSARFLALADSVDELTSEILARKMQMIREVLR